MARYTLYTLKHLLPGLIAAIMIGDCAFIPAQARKVSTRHHGVHTTHRHKEKEHSKSKGSFEVVFTGHHGHFEKDILARVAFSGFDKPASSRKESFFITNNTRYVMTGAQLRLNYITLSGRQLHSKSVKVKCNIPPGETRNVSIPSWDTHGSFFYVHSRAPRHGTATPFEVSIRPERFTFKGKRP